MANVVTTAETNVIKAQQMSKVREVDFVLQFTHNFLPKLIEALGVTRKVPAEEGTTLYYYTTTGTLHSGVVPEGEIIPLSQYQRNKVPFGEISFKKWRKGTTAEAIQKSGYTEAVTETDAEMVSDIQKGIRTDLFTFLNGTITGSTPVTGANLQEVLAQTWGQLQVLFEDDSIAPVHFVNPLDIADYLGKASITTQTAFGMTYIEDFLGLGTVITNSRVTKGTVVSTAKNNLIMYYIRMSGDLAMAFNLTTDETGYIGVHASQTDQRAQVELLAMSGIKFLVEYAQGVVKGTISATTTNTQS